MVAMEGQDGGHGDMGDKMVAMGPWGAKMAAMGT